MCRRTFSPLARLVLLLAIILVSSAATRAQAVYHGNRKSHVFHSSSCRYFDCANCTIPFASSGEAIKAGYRPCSICKPATQSDNKASKAYVASAFVGNSESHILHKSSCRHAGCRNCTIFFRTRQEAIVAGYRPGGCCNP